jgi:hypothetical protein
MDKFSVYYDIGAHLNDCWPEIPRDQALRLAESIWSQFDYSSIATEIDEWAETFCKNNNINH